MITQREIVSAQEKLKVKFTSSALCEVNNHTLYLLPLAAVVASVSPILSAYVKIIRDKVACDMLEEKEFHTFQKFLKKSMLAVIPVDFIIGFIAGRNLPLPHSYYVEEGLKNRLQLGRVK